MIRATLSLLFVSCAAIAFAGCSQEEEESAPAADVLEPGERTLEIESTPEPEADAVALPEGFPDWAPISPSLEITSAEVVDADKRHFKIVANTRSNVEEVMEAYIAKFEADGWEEDMVMIQEGTSIVGFVKNGMLMVVDSKEGGRGSIVTITTGNM